MDTSAPPFSGKVVVVTGASSGIGRELALLLAAERPRLVLAARDEARLTELAAECRTRGAQAVVVATDVGRQEDCRRLVERTLAEYGALDHLVLNAGQGMIARFEDVDDLSVYETVMRVNYFGCVYLTKFALPALKKAGGLITVVGSLTSFTGVPTRTAYAASKHAVLGFFDSLRIELRGTGVDVTFVAPDFVVTEIHRRAIGADGQALGTTPIKESKVMSAATCAALIRQAMAGRKRMAILSLRGRLGRWARLLAPGFIDGIAARAVVKGE